MYLYDFHEVSYFLSFYTSIWQFNFRSNSIRAMFLTNLFSPNQTVESHKLELSRYEESGSFSFLRLFFLAIFGIFWNILGNILDLFFSLSSSKIQTWKNRDWFGWYSNSRTKTNFPKKRVELSISVNF